MPSTIEVGPNELGFWRTHGYLVLRGVLPHSFVQETVEAIYAFLEMDPSDPESWYDWATRAQGHIDSRGMACMYHHPTLWRNRQYEPVYEAFAKLLGCRELYVSTDRVNFNPPCTDGWSYEGFLHWDIDTTEAPLPFAVQGIIGLSDGDAERSGSFQCVAGFHNEIESWLAEHPSRANPRFPDLPDRLRTEVPPAAGDVLIFHGALPHGNSPNRGSTPRIAQYITMMPIAETPPEWRARQLDALGALAPPYSVQGKRFPEDPRGWERQQGFEVALSGLGRQLLGIVPW